MLPAGVYVERLLVPAEYEGFQFLFGKIPIGHQIRDKHGSAVVGGVYRHRLRILKEQTEDELIQEFLPFIGAYDNFARGLFSMSFHFALSVIFSAGMVVELPYPSR